MKKYQKLLLAVRKSHGRVIKRGEDGFACQIPRPNSYSLCITASWGKGWDHVSVHAIMNDKDFAPFWEDMAYIKNLFFKASETVVQYHPSKNSYVNQHEHTLHLWRPQDKKIELPPIWMV